MAQLPQRPLNYMGQDPATAGRARFGKGLFGWVLFIGLAVMLFMLLNSKDARPAMPLSEFFHQLEDKRIASVTLVGDEISGTSIDGQPFRTSLPPGMASNWDFVRWLLETGKGTTDVQVRNPNNTVVNILLPMVPWLLIFLFIWFFVFRQLRKAGQAQPMQTVITGPGRWVPDEPGKAGQA